MTLQSAGLHGAYCIALNRFVDERGSFTRTFCAEEFKEAGLVSFFPQTSIAFNKRRGTLRGMHYQVSPHAETKLICCIAGAVYDVILDLRPDSPTFNQWWSTILQSGSDFALYVPAGCAHGYLTVNDNTELLYQISEPYHPESTRGVRWNDPKFSIKWPLHSPPIMSVKDSAWPDVA